ncbi:Predicted oxidoreductase [Rhizobiales bacterium GAS191]|nr:Predicted oxidoreductase [Rhizobiales bacterium GAS188]SED36570.1 Predicted oxidoreductase [Rhizobiales bacterium GAS191]
MSRDALTSYFTLGRSGLRVSRLALGTMTFGTDWGWGADKEAARAIFDAYVEAGGNLFDTADLYVGGTSETWLGEFIAERHLRDKAVIATKFSYNAEPCNPNAGGNGRKAMMRAVDGSLKRLGTDYIDLYLLHTWDRVTPAEEVMRGFDDLVRSGKVRHVGLSNVPSWYASRAQTLAEWRGYEPLSALQLEYSLAERHIEDEFVPLGVEHGMGIMVWSPLASGLLSGKYRATAEGGAGEGRLSAMAGSDNPAFKKFTPRNFAILAELDKVAKETGRSMAQLALNWVANRPGIASVIIGATKLAQLRDNLGALDFELDAELTRRLDAASERERSFPYTFFDPQIQGMIHGGVAVGKKPARYVPQLQTAGAGASLPVAST